MANLFKCVIKGWPISRYKSRREIEIFEAKLNGSELNPLIV